MMGRHVFLRFRVRKFLRKGQVDEALQALRDAGYDKPGSILFLYRAAQYDLILAKQMVHASPVWEDVRQRDEEFHDRCFKALQRMDQEERGDLGV